MSFEFVARNGLIALDNSTITGSLIVTNGITGSLSGSAISASYALSASYATGSGFASSASFSISSSLSSRAVTASYAITASYLSGSIDSASFAVSSSISSRSITGSYALTASVLLGSITSASYAATASVLLGSITSASYAATASVVLGSITSASFSTTSSYAFTASHALNAGGGSSLSGGTANYIPLWTGASSQSTSSIYQSGSRNVAINTITFDATTPESLLVSSSNFNAIVGRANIDNYVQLNITNKSAGNFSSADIVATNDAGNETGNYVDLGINSSTFGGLIGGVNDGYLYHTGSNFLIGNITRGNVALKFFSGNDATETPLTVSGSNTFVTGSLLGTASFATSASYAGSTSNATSASIATNAVTASRALNANTASYIQNAASASYAATASYSTNFTISGSLYFLSTPPFDTSSVNILTYDTASDQVEYSTINDLTFTKNIINVGLTGSRGVRYNVIKTAVQSITDASENNTYTVRVYPGIYIEDTITVPSWVAVKGDSSISTIVSASNPSQSIFIMSDQSMIIDMQLQGSIFTGSSAVYYSSATTPQRNAIAYVENVRFGTNYTNATCAGSGSGNCILQCSNVKYGGWTDNTLQKSFDIGFRVTGSGGSIGRMQLRNVTSTNGGVAGSDQNQIFALADAPGCTFIVNGCLLTRAVGSATGTGFKVYNGGSLRLTGVNFQRWVRGIWAPQTGSAPSIDAIALNFENCTTDVAIEHTGSTGKVQGTDNFLKTQIALSASLYEVGQDPRRITVGTKGADFTSISASVAYITDSSENNRYVIEVGPGQFYEKTIDLTGKPYVSIVGSNIQTTQIFPSSSNQHIIKMGINNEVSFLSLAGAGPGYSALYVDNVGDFAQAHKISIYNCDRGITINASTTDTQFYGEYIDINGTFSYGTYVSSSNAYVDVSMENYFLFPSASATIGNFVVGPSSSLGVRSAVFTGDSTAGSIAFQLQDGATLEGSSIDIPDWDKAVYIPNIGSGPLFRFVGTMIHNSVTNDFDIQNSTTIGRFQGISDHTKISNNSNEFYWNFLDDTDGENDVTRKLSVTFADGTHTDATTLIFNGSPMGVMSGGSITTSGGLAITASSGFGYCEDPLDTGIYKRIDWNNSSITLTAESNNYIYINYNGTLSASGTAPSSLYNIILGRVVTNNTAIEFIDQTPYDAAHMSNKLSKFNREALGPVYDNGSIVTENATTARRLDVSQGSYFFSEDNFLPAGTSSLNFTQYYRSGSGWNRTATGLVPNNTWDSGSNVLVALSASAYTKHTLYGVGEGVNEKYFLVIGQNQYGTLVEAEGGNLPTPPTYFNDGVVSLASIYVRSGSANIIQIEDIRPIIGFRAAGVNASSVHGNLLGLSADDHTQYLRVDGFREMTGGLGLGGNDLYNFNIVSGSYVTATSVTSSVANITSITGSLLGNASTSTTASFAATASYSVSSSFAFNTVTASRALQANTASYATFAASSSYALTASFALNGGGSPGGGDYTVTTVTTTYSETATSGKKIILANTTGGTFTITLPTAVGNTAELVVKKIAGAPAVTVDGAGTETIDDGLTATINKLYESITLIASGSEWYII